MNSDQLIEVREHLINELNSNGFGTVVTEVYTRLEESYEVNEFEKSPHSLLTFFLSESIDVLNCLSNKNYDKLLSKFNEFNSGDNQIESISVELLNQGEPMNFDLKKLPDYREIIETLKNILNKINNEN